MPFLDGSSHSHFSSPTGDHLVGFRFSPNLNQAQQINWLQWGENAFAEAQSENKPVLLSVSAVWCYWCHVMDESSYSDKDVVNYINDNFIAIRVDNDHRPDINIRYNVGGWPTTAFLNGHGGLMAGATYLPPDQLLAMLTEVQRAYQEQKPQLYEQANDLLKKRKDQVSRVTAGKEVGQGLVDRIARGVAGAFDVLNGGFGTEPKFPNPDTLHFLILLLRSTGEDFYSLMINKTLNRMADSDIFDQEEGGFFRHCANSDWTMVQREKMLEDNISLARVYLDSCILLDNERYRQIASETINYIMKNMFDNRVLGFRGSQGAHSEYFTLPSASRYHQTAPPIDPSCYVHSSSQAVSLLLDASWTLNQPSLAKIALSVLDAIENMAQQDQLSHVYPETGPNQGSAFLTDWANLLNALLDAYYHTSQKRYLERAKQVANEMVNRFSDDARGGFFDIEEKDAILGYLKVREKPLPENVIAARGLLRLHYATRLDSYRELARITLNAYVDTYRDYGEFAASYGAAVHLYLNSPVEITIEGHPEHAATRTMLTAATKISFPHLIIKSQPTSRAKVGATAHICLNTVCLPPINDPNILTTTVYNMISSRERPLENITDLPSK
jgi:uncharacterized protein YyaL (SSP411 family)